MMQQKYSHQNIICVFNKVDDPDDEEMSEQFNFGVETVYKRCDAKKIDRSRVKMCTIFCTKSIFYIELGMYVEI